MDDFFLYVLLLPDKKIDLTILLLFGGTVNPVVLICCPNHFELMEHDFEVPHIWNKRKNIRCAVTGPVLDQIWTHTKEEKMN